MREERRKEEGRGRGEREREEEGKGEEGVGREARMFTCVNGSMQHEPSLPLLHG